VPGTGRRHLDLRPARGAGTTPFAGEGQRPETIVSDNGTELTSNAILSWADETGVAWHYIAPGKPQQNGFIESFIGWMTPRGYPSALSGETGRGAALGWTSRPGLLPPTIQQAQINPGLSFRLDERPRSHQCRSPDGNQPMEGPGLGDQR